MKKIILIVLTLIAILSLTGCNQQILDTTYKFDEAIISLPNGEVVEGTVSSWKDYEDSDQIQVVIDGTSYYTHSSNVVMINR